MGFDEGRFKAKVKNGISFNVSSELRDRFENLGEKPKSFSAMFID